MTTQLTENISLADEAVSAESLRERHRLSVIAVLSPLILLAVSVGLRAASGGETPL
jgi:hypothetical protein